MDFPLRSPRLCGEVRSSGFSLLRAQGSLKAELQTWDKWVRGVLFFWFQGEPQAHV